MELLAFLIVFPVLIAALLLAVRAEKARRLLVCAASAAIALASIALMAMNLGTGWVSFAVGFAAADAVCALISILVAGVVIAFAVRYRNVLAGFLAAAQLIGSLVFEFLFAHELRVQNGLYVDSLSLLMTFVIGVVGSGICVYAIGYMADFQAHEPKGAKDRRPAFFSLMFAFLGAMFLIVLSDNMVWLFAGWEVTTACSFLLIGFTRTDEAIRNAFRQINMNLLGGIAFLAALYASAIRFETLSLSELIAIGASHPELVALPVAALAFAGLAKAAQMPFHTWLLGAMVAPTPTSALLHSSTMVKAGVFLLVKLAPVLAVCVVPQLMVTLVGGITFLLCSMLAISQSNAKRVLAYSTIANLGLIAVCAGLGSAEAVWAACFLVLFHAIAKSLLFLCVGTAEHRIGSRNIENMDLLFERMPRLARFMMVGIMCMFIAPFGMLLSKWAAIVAVADSGNAILMLLLVFGSAATFMFWAKWLGKLSGIAGSPENVERAVHGSEWLAISLMVGLAILGCATMPLVSAALVEPYLAGAFGAAVQTITDDNLWIAAVAALAVLAVLFGGIGRKGSGRRVGVYLSGVSVDDRRRLYLGSRFEPVAAPARNMYLEPLFGERLVSPFGTVLSAALLVATLTIAATSFALPL